LFSACRSPSIILIPSGSTLINPLKFRRSQDFSIVSLIELNCNYPASIQSQWILKNNSNIILFDSQIETTSIELFIPAKKTSFWNLWTWINYHSQPISNSEKFFISLCWNNSLRYNCLSFSISIIHDHKWISTRFEIRSRNLFNRSWSSYIWQHSKFSINFNPHYF